MEKLRQSSVIKNWQTETPVLRSLEKVLGLFNFDSFPRIQRAAFVDMYKGEETQKCFDALLQNPALPVVLMDIGGGKVLDHALKKSPLLTQIVQFPNVRRIDSLELITELPTLYQKSRFSFTQEQSQNTKQLIQSHIRHDLGHALRGNTHYDKSRLIERAIKELGFTGSESDIITAVMEQKKTIQPTSFYKIDGLFVDWDGTLYKDGNFSSELFKYASSKAEEEQLPLAIWTGGNVDMIYRTLNQLNISNIDVCSKQDCRELNILAAIDDESIVALADYGIEVKNLQIA